MLGNGCCLVFEFVFRAPSLPLLNHIICSTSYLVYFTCRIRRLLVAFVRRQIVAVKLL